MAERMCWAIVPGNGLLPHVAGVFKQKKAAFIYADNLNSTIAGSFAPLPPVNWRPVKLSRKDVVARLRSFVFHRDKQECIACGQALTWETMEMHEKVPRGKGGDMTIDNCESRCHDCHTGKPGSAHGNRRPKFSRRVER